MADLPVAHRRPYLARHKCASEAGLPGPAFGEFQRGLEIRNGARGLSGASSAAGCLGSSGAALSRASVNRSAAW